MGVVRVNLPKSVWQELVSLGREETASPDQLLEQAVRDFVEERRRQRKARKALQQSFAIWSDRDDWEADSSLLVEKWRRDWDERQQRLDLD